MKLIPWLKMLFADPTVIVGDGWLILPSGMRVELHPSFVGRKIENDRGNGVKHVQIDRLKMP